MAIEVINTTTHRQETIFRSKLPDIPIPNHLPLHTFLFQNIAHFPHRPCLIDAATGHTLTYADVHRTSRKLAAGFSNLGLGRGDVIMLLLPNCPEFPLAFLAASYIGAVVTPTNPLYTPTEVIQQAESSGAKLVITRATHVHIFKDYATEHGLKVVCIDHALEHDLDLDLDFIHFSEVSSADETDLPEVEIEADDTVALPYSSGTTGMPKGVMLTHKGLVTTVAQQVDGENPNMYLHSEDVILALLPLFHIFGLNSELLCGLRVGAAIVIIQRFDMTAFFEMIHKYKVTFFPLVPPIALSISKSTVIDKYDLSSVRMAMFGAAPLGKELEDAVRDKFPNAIIGQGYGMTEAGPVLSLCLGFAKNPFLFKSGSSGTVVRNAEMKIIDAETGNSLGYNQPGEFCIRGNQIMKGYLNNPEATKQTIDEHGWLHTGDVGFIDDDDELFIVDRVKEMIKYKGYQVSPAEIEAMLFNHPSIHDAAVAPMKDEEAGEIPVAFVVPANESTVTEEEIMQFVRTEVVFYKRIKRVFFIQEIPKSNTGKILRKQLKAMLSQIDSI